ncbi:MAG: hypothetical protein IPI36_02080 [Chitinophagaceae bacterium]|nr:hypothetical protein [Chitinophagaceae bacterium]
MALLLHYCANAQQNVAFDIIKASSQTIEKFTEWAKKKNFYPAPAEVNGEMNFTYKPGKKSIDKLPREITLFTGEKNLCFSYKTFAEKEFADMLGKLGKEGFKGNTQKKITGNENIFLQKIISVFISLQNLLIRQSNILFC